MTAPPQFALACPCRSTVIGLRCKDGVVLAVEKLILSKLLVEGSNRRIYNVDRHAGVVRASGEGTTSAHMYPHVQGCLRDCAGCWEQQ